MSTAELKQNIINLLQSTEDESKLIVAYNALKKDNEHDWWDDLTDEQKASVEKGIKQADNGELIPHNEARKQIDALLAKHA